MYEKSRDLGQQLCARPTQEAPFANDSEQVKRGLIACEFGDLLTLASELEDAVAQLNKKLSPVLLLRDEKPPMPCKPECALPPLGNALREVRQRIGRQVEELRQLNQACEL